MAKVEHLLEVLPNPATIWIPLQEPTKFSGISVRTILNRHKAGAFRKEIFHMTSRGSWKYRRELAMADLEKVDRWVVLSWLRNPPCFCWY